jgi:hypothetical protein
MKAYSNQTGETVSITDEDSNAQTTLVFNQCVDSNYTISGYAAKIFVQNCENISITLLPESKILTETIEVHRTVEAKLSLGSRIGTLQIDQSENCECTYETRDVFGNPTMVRKGREFGNDGRVVWAGCENLKVTVKTEEGEDSVVGDFATEEKADATVNEERTQFKVSYDAKGTLRSEKVVRLENGFPSTKREDDEHARREEMALQGLAERMGVTLNKKTEDIGARQKPNDPCKCGSGKKFKKCCWN